MKSSALKIMVLTSLLMTLASCSPIQGNSLLTDQKDDPSTHTLDKTPKQEEIYLKSFSPSAAASGLSKIEISGECYVSTYPSHDIISYVNGTQRAVLDLNATTAAGAGIATCKNGKFNLAIETGSWAAGVYTVRLVLRAYEANNPTPITNDAQGASTLTVTR
ncbi:hypothetical protein QJS83_11095 [Bdellovibrio sp. 22V]|uniref:hypothetical protein n=1 Tax=Bdellovibrio TaxID=958 RepID=UPI002543C426|nr:hypothetical protein [Bdellovibrio sp. 22V]WII71007.1 hypothetical protein QJS83_11095 [Bdellovibrio sp. 22V]